VSDTVPQSLNGNANENSNATDDCTDTSTDFADLFRGVRRLRGQRAGIFC